MHSWFAIASGCTGELSPFALKHIMGVMRVARYCRGDLLRAVSATATRVTQWNERDDEKLTRLISYMHNTSELRKIGFIGDALKDLRLVLYTDANFAGDRSDMTSTSGGFLCLWAHTVAPRLTRLQKSKLVKSVYD